MRNINSIKENNSLDLVIKKGQKYRENKIKLLSLTCMVTNDI